MQQNGWLVWKAALCPSPAAPLWEIVARNSQGPEVLCRVKAQRSPASGWLSF